MSAARLAGTLVRLKLALLRGGLRLGAWQAVGTVLAWLAALLAGIATLLLAVHLRLAVGTDEAAATTVLAGSLLVLGWILVPVLTAGVDDTLEPGRFALLPVPASRLVPGLTLAGVVGAPGLVALCAAVALVVVWSGDLLAAAVAVVAGPLGVLTCVVASRLSTGWAARLLGGRRAREATTLVALVVLSGAGLLPVALSALLGRAGRLEVVVAVLGWTPLGLPWAAPAAVASGDVVGGLARLVLAALVVVAGLAAWTPMLRTDLVSPLSTGGPAATVGRSVVDRVPTGPVWAVTARRLTAWRRDPRYLAALVAPVIASAAPVVIGLTSPDGEGRGLLLVVGPVVSALLALTSSNDVGYDGSAFAAHLVTAVPGRADRLGRCIATLVVALPLSLVASVAGALLAGRPELVPGMVGIGLALLLAGIGAGSVSGALAAYPMPEAGSNPFRANSGASGRALVGQLATTGVTGAAATPSIALTVTAALVDDRYAWLALVVGAGLGAAALAAGVVLGGRVVDARGPELLAAVRRAT